MIPIWQARASDLREYADQAEADGMEKIARDLREAADELERLGEIEQRYLRTRRVA